MIKLISKKVKTKMKQIGDTILTRKAFRDLTWIENGNTKSRWVEVNNTLGRWRTYNTAIKFIDNCLLPSNIDGKTLVMSIDCGKAKYYTPDNIITAIEFLRYEQSQFETPKDILDAISTVTDAYRDVDVIYFENLCLDSLGNLKDTFLATLKSYVRRDVVVVFGTREVKDLGHMLQAKFFRDRMDISVNTNPTSVTVLKAPSGLCGYNYIHSYYG